MFLDRLPIAAWKLDDTGSTAIDSIGSLDGTHDAGVTPNVSGKINKGAKYDSTLSNSGTDFGQIPELSFEHTQPFSVSFWFQYDTVIDQIGVFVANNIGDDENKQGWLIGLLSSNGVYFHLNNITGSNWIFGDGVPSGITLKDGNPHHVILSYDGTGVSGGIRFFIDGVPTTSGIRGGTLSATTVNPNSVFTFGCYGPATDRAGYCGLDFLDDVAVFDVALTWREAYLIYKNGLLGTSIADFTTPTIDSNSGHELDENTAALWRLDEVASYGHPHLKTSKAEIDPAMSLVQTDNNTAPQICGGPKDGMDARWFDGSARLGQLASSDIISTLTNGDYSVECWIYWDGTITATNSIIAFNAVGETLATNALLLFRIVSGPQFDVFWEHGSGTNEFFTTSGTFPITPNTWNHVALIVADAGGGLRDISIYTNGTLYDSTTGLTAAEGGAVGTTEITVGAELTVSHFNGAISDIRISNTTRSGAQPTDQHELDGNTIELWRLNEPPEARCLTQILEVAPHFNPRRNSNDSNTLDPVGALIGGGGHGRYANGVNDQWLEFSGTEELRQIFLGEWTWEGWIQLEENPSNTTRTLMGWDRTGETQETNPLLLLRYNHTSKKFEPFWENGAGIDVESIFQTVNLLDPMFGQDRRHIALSKTDEGGGASYQLDLYVDGEHIETITGVGPADGGEIGDLYLCSAVGGLLPWKGRVDDIRLSNVARTPAEIQTSYERGAIATGAPTRYYLMAAIDNNADGSPGQEQPFYRTWKVQDEPDPTAALYEGSFFGASINFTNIYIQATWTE